MTTETPDTNWKSCEFCDAVPSMDSITGWYGRLDENNSVVSFVCGNCYDSEKVPGRFVTDMKMKAALEIAPPLRGNFRPVKSDEEIIHARTESIYGPFWLDIEEQAFEALSDHGSLVLNLSVSSRFYNGITITPKWDEGVCVGLQVSGDNPAKKLQLDIYQAHRLGQMGYVVEGDRIQTWSLELSQQERTPANIARIVSHTLEFAYMLKPPRIGGFTVTLDIDITKDKL